MELNKYFFEVLRNRLENILRPLSGNYKARIVYGDTTATDIKNTVILSARNEIIPGKTPSLAELYLSYKGSTAHEGAHIRYTSLSAWKSATARGAVFQHLTNIIEDGRIEALISERLPGAGKWIRFKNNYIYDNRPPEHYGKGLNAFLGGLIIYSVLQKIPAFLPPDVINIVKLAAPYVDIGKAASCTEDVLPQVEKIMVIPEVQDLIDAMPPPIMLPDTGSSKPEKASSQKAQERAEKAEKIIKRRLNTKKTQEESEEENKPRAKSKPEDPEESKPEETQSSKTDSEKPEELEPSEQNESNEESQSSKPNESEESKGSEESGNPNEKNDAGSETTSDSEEPDESEAGSGESENTDSDGTDADSEGQSENESGTNPGDSDSEPSDNEGSEENSDDSELENDPEESEIDPDTDSTSGDSENPEDSETDSDNTDSEAEYSNNSKDFDGSDNSSGSETDGLDEPEDYNEPEDLDENNCTGRGDNSDDNPDNNSEEGPANNNPNKGDPGDPKNKDNPGEDDFFDEPEDDFFDEPEEEDFQELVESLEEEVSTLTEEAKEIEEDAREIDPLQGIKYYAGFQIREISKNPQQYQKLKKQNQILIKNLVQEIEIAIETRKAYDLRGLNRGRLNSSSLWKLAVPDPSVFSRRIIPGDIPELAAYILVDCSGSMSGCTNGIVRIDAVKNAACVLSEACRTLKIPHAVTGFDDCGRSTYHYPAVTWDDGDSSKIPSLRASVANRDGFSIRIAANELSLRHEPRKILFVLSDGQPATNNYHGKSALNDVKNAVIETKKKGMQVISLFFGTNNLIPDFRYMYDTPVFVNNINFLPRTLGDVFKKVLLQ